MFVYENKNHEICVVFDGVIPAETPDYVLKLDEAAKKLYVNGVAIDAQVAEEEPAESEPAEEPVVETPDETSSEEPEEVEA